MGRTEGRRRRWAVAVGGAILTLVAIRWGLKGLSAGPEGREARIAVLGLARLVYPLFVPGIGVASLALIGLGTAMGKGRPRRGLVRGLALLASAGLAVLIAEAAGAAYLARVHRVPTPPRLGPRADRDVHVLVVGESSAEGVPYRDWLSVGKVVAWELRRALPWRAVHLEVQARPGWTLEQMHQRLIESRSRPDVVIVYAGHNEFASRFGWSSGVPYYADEPLSVEALARRLERWSPLGRALAELHEKELVAAPPRRARREPADVPSHTEAQREAIRDDFRRRLEGIVASCEALGALPVLVIPPGNDAGFEPNRSILPPEMPRVDREAFAAEVAAARRIEGDDPAGAVRRYRDLIARQPGFAETHFRLARLLEASGEFAEAARHYAEARDLDGHPMRCPTALQEIYRDVAARRGVLLVDGPAVLRARHPRGQLDDTLFHDAMHPSFEGHVALAEAVLAALKGRRSLGWPEETPAPRIDLAECARHFDVTPAAWASAAEFAASFYRTTAPIRHDGSERLAKADRYGAALERLRTPHPEPGPDVPGIGLRTADGAGPFALDRRTTSGPRPHLP